MKYEPDQDRFLADVATHGIEVIMDGNDAYRHIRFKRPESGTYWFDLTTWPGHLCISGDMGTYVFSRVRDMFTFFRHESINPGYWGEKLQAVATNGGYREFDEKEFRDRVEQYFRDYWEDTDYPDARDECRVEVKESVLDRADNEWEAYHAVQDFEFRYGPSERRKFFQFQDFFDGGGTERYSYSFIWVLRAIVWGIHKYDDWKGAK